MSGATTKGPFDVKDFVQKVSAFASANPSLSKRAYAKAAERIRAEAKGRPEEAALIALSANLDALAKSAPTPIVGMPEDYEEPYLGSEDPLVEERIEIGYEDHEHEINMNVPMEDSFADAAVQQAGAVDVARSVVQPVQVTPASAQDGVTLFGNSVVVQAIPNAPGAPATNTGGVPLTPAEAQCVRWDGTNSEVTACTVAVSRGSAGATFPSALAQGGAFLSLPANLGNLSYRPYFHLMWGAGQGQFHEVYGDVGRGAQFTVAATHLYVNVGMDDGHSSGVFNGSMQLTASMGFFTAARQSPVFRTVYVDLLAAGGTQTIIIPLFATTIEGIFGLSPSNSFSFAVQSTETTLGVLNGANMQVRSNAVALPNQAYQIFVTNTGAQTGSCQIVFGLSL